MELQNLPIPYQGDCPYIFVSYSHKNASKVLPVIEQLQTNHYRVWYDEGIDPGTEWDENIAQHVEQCGFFIAFLSPEYLSSSNCRDELNYARDLDKNRLLVYLSDVELPGGMSMRLSRLQAIHMYTYANQETFLQKLFMAPGIDRCLEDVEQPSSEPDCIEKSTGKSELEKTNQGHSISVNTDSETPFQELPRTKFRFLIFCLLPLISLALNGAACYIYANTAFLASNQSSLDRMFNMGFYNGLYATSTIIFTIIWIDKKTFSEQRFKNVAFTLFSTHFAVFLYLFYVIAGLYYGNWALVPSAKEWLVLLSSSEHIVLWVDIGTTALCILSFLVEVIFRKNTVRIWSCTMAAFYLIVLIYYCVMKSAAPYVIFELIAAIIFHSYISAYLKFWKEVKQYYLQLGTSSTSLEGASHSTF